METRRILAVSLAESADYLSQVIKDLTGAVTGSDLAGSTHLLELRTAYYTASVPVWLDLIECPSEWASSFLSEEAREVLTALGALLVVFVLPVESSPELEPSAAATHDLLRETGRLLRQGLGGWDWDGVAVALGIGASIRKKPDTDALDVWDQACAEAGFEFVYAQAGDSTAGNERNEFGEKTGLPRLVEVLETNEWHVANAGPDPQSDPLHEPNDNVDDSDEQGLSLGITGEDAQVLRTAMLAAAGDGHAGPADRMRPDLEEADEGAVDRLEGMMRRLHAVKEAVGELPDTQRRRLAAQAVAEVMRDL